MRAVIAMMSHETNTFSPVPTPLARFARTHGIAGAEDAAALVENLSLRRSGLFVSAKRVAEPLRELAELGVGQVLLWMSFGGMAADVVEDSLRRAAGMARQVESAQPV